MSENFKQLLLGTPEAFRSALTSVSPGAGPAQLGTPLPCSECKSRPFPEEPEARLYFTNCTRLAPLLTIALCHYEANSKLATHIQPQVQEPSAC